MALTSAPNKSNGLTEGNRYVVSAVLCSRCESVIQENVEQMLFTSIVKEMEVNENLFETVIPHHSLRGKDVGMTYRKLIYRNGCISC